jgi:hypothetical protein
MVSTTRVFWKWALIGLLMASFLCWAQVREVGGVAGLLQVGETSALRPLIEEQLGSVPLAEGPGHDGQIFYAIGLDLDGNEVGPLLDHASYRYRRILFPLLASGFGLLDGQALLWAQLSIGVISFAVACGLVAAMAARSSRTELLALTVLINPGLWLSMQLVTSDAFSLALMVGALWFAASRTSARDGLFSLSVLAKDVSLATPVPLGMQRRDWRMAVIPCVILIVWMTVLDLRFGDGFASRGNLTWPFRGLIDATGNWPELDGREWVFLSFALASLATGVVFSLRRSWLRWPLVAWTGLTVVSSNWVWDFGNNAARAFAPIVVLAALSLTHRAAGTASERVERTFRSGI